MNFSVAVLERQDFADKLVHASCGVLINEKYLITTANVMLPLADKHFMDRIHTLDSGILTKDFRLEDTFNIKVCWKTGNFVQKRIIRKDDFLGVFISNSVKATYEECFDSWSVDVSTNYKALNFVFALFFVFKIGLDNNYGDFIRCIDQWWYLTRKESVTKCDDLYTVTAPFGNQLFLDSFSKGIVSNILGYNSCIIVSDCPTTPGSEGSPAYKAYSQENAPFGMVLASSCWWKGVWTGLTLLVDLRPVLLELLVDVKPDCSRDPKSACVDLLTSSFLQISCGQQWGTGIVISADDGILLTNSHVVDYCHAITVICGGKAHPASILYKVPEEEALDLAVLQCDKTVLSHNGVNEVQISHRAALVGDEVLVAGFPIFSADKKLCPTFSKGHVAHSNESMIKTTCSINPGMSGGGLLNSRGELVGIAVCNTRLDNNVYTRYNMAIPYKKIKNVMDQFLIRKDVTLLEQLRNTNPDDVIQWMNLRSKL